jgi:hypothetical protein
VCQSRRRKSERTSKTDARLFCPPRHPARFLALWSRIVHHGPHETAHGLFAQAALVVFDERERRRLAQARQGRELLPEREGRPPRRRLKLLTGSKPIRDKRGLKIQAAE